MDILKKKSESVGKALATLEKAIVALSKHDRRTNEDVYITYRDSLIKRFEYSSDLFWKLLKEYLEVRHGVLAAAPKSVYRECLVAQVLTEDETKTCIAMVEARNQTAHIYREESAEYIAGLVPGFCKLMTSIFNRITK
jgi:nucleotidyltransferase substrate binding protein (TIGR01987 family)